MTPASSRLTRLALAALLAGVLSGSGCAWRGAGVEHYLGPVAFRYRPPHDGGGAVSQIVRVGLSVEGGAQWGIAAGVAERLAAAPLVREPGDAAGAPSPLPRWIVPVPLFGPPRPERWNVSLFYLRVDAMPRATLVVRRLVGAEVTLGDEAAAASIGFTSRTLVSPPPDAFSLVDFDSRRPLDTVVTTWRAGRTAAHDAFMSLEEDLP